MTTQAPPRRWFTDGNGLIVAATDSPGLAVPTGLSEPTIPGTIVPEMGGRLVGDVYTPPSGQLTE